MEAKLEEERQLRLQQYESKMRREEFVFQQEREAVDPVMAADPQHPGQSIRIGEENRATGKQTFYDLNSVQRLTDTQASRSQERELTEAELRLRRVLGFTEIASTERIAANREAGDTARAEMGIAGDKAITGMNHAQAIVLANLQAAENARGRQVDREKIASDVETARAQIASAERQNTQDNLHAYMRQFLGQKHGITLAKLQHNFGLATLGAQHKYRMSELKFSAEHDEEMQELAGEIQEALQDGQFEQAEKMLRKSNVHASRLLGMQLSADQWSKFYENSETFRRLMYTEAASAAAEERRGMQQEKLLALSATYKDREPVIMPLVETHYDEDGAPFEVRKTYRFKDGDVQQLVGGNWRSTDELETELAGRLLGQLADARDGMSASEYQRAVQEAEAQYLDQTGRRLSSVTGAESWDDVYSQTQQPQESPAESPSTWGLSDVLTPTFLKATGGDASLVSRALEPTLMRAARGYFSRGDGE
jgi:hypothetical protein